MLGTSMMRANSQNGKASSESVILSPAGYPPWLMTPASSEMTDDAASPAQAAIAETGISSALTKAQAAQMGTPTITSRTWAAPAKVVQVPHPAAGALE